MNRPKNSLIARLVVSFLSVSLMTVLIVGLMSYERARSALKTAVIDRLNATIELKEDALNRWLDQQLDDLIFIKTQPAVQEAAELLLREEDPERASHAYNTLFGVFQILFVNMKDFSDIALLSSKGGEVVVSSKLENEGDFRVSDTYFIEGLKGPFIQEIYLSPVTFKPTITVASPIYDQSGQSMGVLAANLDMDRLDDIVLERSGLGKTGESYLVDSTNTFVTGKGFGRAEFPRGAHSTGINNALAGQSGTGLYTNYAGVPVIGAFKWVEERQLAIMAEIHQSEAFAPARNLAFDIAIVGCLMSIFLTVVVNFLARRIASPILAVRNAAEGIASGDRNTRAPIIRDDEVGDLARSFNLMVDEIQESEERYRLLADNVSDVIWTMDMNLKLTYVSPSTVRFRGYSPENVISHSIEEMLTPESLETVQKVLGEEMALESMPGSDPDRTRVLELQFIHKDWRLVWGEVVIGFIRDQGGKATGIMGATRDITERKEAEKELRESEKRFRTVFRTSPGAIVITRVKDSVIVDLNDEIVRLWGINRDELIGKTALEMRFWKDEKSRDIVVEKLKSGETVDNLELQFQAPNGRVITGLLSASKVMLEDEPHIIFTVQDITEIKEAQSALQESEDKFRTIFMTSPDSVSISNLEDGKFVDVNEGFERLTEYSREEALEMTSLDLWCDPGERQRMIDAINDCGEIHNLEGQFRIKSGEIRTGLLSARVVTLGDDKYVLGVQKDITARKETERLLLSTQYSIDTSNIVVLWIKPDAQLAYVNDAACRHFGFTREELLTMYVPDIDPGWTSDYWNREGWERVKKAGKLTFESRNRHKDGTILPVEVSTSYFEFEGEEYVFAFIQDITERKEALDALREREEKYRLLADNVSDVIWVWDRDLKPTYYSPSVYQLRGVTPEEAVQQPLEEIMTPESLKVAHEMIARELALDAEGRGVPASHILTTELEMICKDETTIWVEVNMRIMRDPDGAMTRIVGVSRDISRRKMMEKALRESEERYRILFNAGSDAIFAHGLGDDGMPSNFYTVNDVACEMLGMSKTELMELDTRDISRFRDDEELKEIIRKILKDKRGIFESTFIDSSGREIPVEVSAHVFELYERPTIISIARDITERKRIEEERKRIQTRLIQANKMTSLGLMVSSLAHEINNPNNTIMFNLRRFAKTWEDILPILNDYYEEHGDFNVGGVPFSELSAIFPRLISGTLESSEMIKAIIENLKGFVRQSTDTLDFNVDVNDVVRSAVSLLESQVRKGMGRLEVDLAEKLPRIKGNPQKLVQVMVNLISNALEALTGEMQGIRVSSSYDAGDSVLKLTVVDEGEGMTKEQITNATEPFYSTKLQSGGTGLGLTITKMLLDEHGADLYFDSNPGQGTTVTVAIKVDMSGTVH
jgi:PAS domain S-box-containing protein